MSPRGDRPASRSSWRLVVDPMFGPFFFGKLISNIGVWIYNIVAALVTYDMTGSALAVAIVSALQFIPQVLSPLSGAAADRHGNRLGQLLLGRAVTTVGCATMAVIFGVFGADALSGIWPIAVVGFVVGTGFMIGSPAMQSMIPSLVRPHELARAVALDGIPLTIARALGPALGALSLSALGATTSFTIAAVTQAVFFLLLLRLSPARINREGSPNGRTEDHRVRAALRHLLIDPPVGLLLLGVAAIAIGTDPVLTLAPSLSQEFGRGTDLVQHLVFAFGAGTAVGYLAVGPLQACVGSARLAQTGMWVIVGGLAVMALAPGPGYVVCALVGMGIGLSTAFAGLTTLLHQRVPEALRGRIMALWLLALLGTRPMATLTSGFIAELRGVASAFAVSAVTVGGIAVIARPGRLTKPVPGRDEALADSP